MEGFSQNKAQLNMNEQSDKRKPMWLIVLVTIVVVPLIVFGDLVIIEVFKNTSSQESILDSIQPVNKEGGEPVIGMWDSQNKNNVPPLKQISSVVVEIVCPAKNETFSLESNGSAGSGTMWTEDGLVISNLHIISEDKKKLDVSDKGCFILLPDDSGLPKEIYLARPIVFDDLMEQYDLALFQIYDAYSDEKGNVYGQWPRQFTSFDISQCNKGLVEKQTTINLGDKLKVFGYPVTNGFNLVVTEGIVSGFSREGFVLTSAQIDHGNSGGLAVGEDNCMVGIPTAVSEGDFTNLGLIIPESRVADFLTAMWEHMGR